MLALFPPLPQYLWSSFAGGVRNTGVRHLEAKQFVAKYDEYGGGRGLNGTELVIFVQQVDLRTKGGLCRAGNVRDMPFGGAFVYVCVAVHAVGLACTDVSDLFSTGDSLSAINLHHSYWLHFALSKRNFVHFVKCCAKRHSLLLVLRTYSWPFVAGLVK